MGIPPLEIGGESPGLRKNFGGSGGLVASDFETPIKRMFMLKKAHLINYMKRGKSG